MTKTTSEKSPNINEQTNDGENLRQQNGCAKDIADGVEQSDAGNAAAKKGFGQKLKDLWNYFSLYEKIWYISILILAVIFAFIFPEEDVNGFNGNLIMACYLADIILNITCELLISKQSKWNFIVSLGVEVVEIVTLILLASRFATMAVTIFFWIPVDIVSFVNWHRHKDNQNDELTVVRTLNKWQSIVVIAIVVVWTAVVGYLMARFAPDTDFYDSDMIIVAIAYLDACVSVVGIFNGLFILFRFREQWIAWYIDCALETVINILSGQWVLLVLKAGYLTNTTYGYIKWTRYIKQHHTIVGSSDETKQTKTLREKLQSKVPAGIAWITLLTVFLVAMTFWLLIITA